MPRGRESRTLDADRIRQLKDYQRAMYRAGRGGSVQTLKLAMEAPFKWGVLQKALQGKRIWIMNYLFIVEWIDKHLEESPHSDAAHLIDRKLRSAGERDEELDSRAVGQGEPGGAPARLRSEGSREP